MTKKSLGRQDRDARAAGLKNEMDGNQNWTELRNQYFRQVGALAQLAKMGEVLNNRELLECVPHLDNLTTNLHILKRDIEVFHRDLQAIYASHSTMSGPATVDNIMDSYKYAEAYHGWMMRYEAVLVPLFQNILEQTSQGEVVWRQRKMAADAAAGATTTTQP
jgi:hypothetical protein